MASRIVRWRIAVTLIVAAWAWSSSASAEPSGRVYVASQDGAAISVIDVETHELIATVDLTALGFSANCKPHHVAVEPDGSHWYVSLIADWRVLKFDRDNNLVGQVEFDRATSLKHVIRQFNRIPVSVLHRAE